MCMHQQTCKNMVVGGHGGLEAINIRVVGHEWLGLVRDDGLAE